MAENWSRDLLDLVLRSESVFAKSLSKVFALFWFHFFHFSHALISALLQLFVVLCLVSPLFCSLIFSLRQLPTFSGCVQLLTHNRFDFIFSDSTRLLRSMVKP